LAHAQSSDDYWQLVRALFAFDEQHVPMNAANLCPSFSAVADAVQRLTTEIDLDVSFNNRARFGELLEGTRVAVAGQLGVSADEVALVRNTSEANNIVNNGLDLGPGDEVLVWQENHPTNHVAWQVRAARFGFAVRVVETPPQVSSDSLLQAFTDLISPRTKVLAITHVSNVSGICLPLLELTRAAQAQGVFVHVDGAQTWGAMALDLRAAGVDAFTASAHKWFMGPKEVGLLYVREERIDEIWPSVVASGWGSAVAPRPAGARRFESLGQRDDAALAALGVCAALHDRIGPARIEQRTRALAQRLKQGMTDIGLQLVTPMEPELSFGVCIAESPADRPAGEIINRLYGEHGIAGAATGGLRLCPAVYNTESHVDRAVRGLAALI